MGGTPYIKSKSNTTSKSYGSHSWRVMVLLFMQSKDEFYKHYRQRSIVSLCLLPQRSGVEGAVAFVPV